MAGRRKRVYAEGDGKIRILCLLSFITVLFSGCMVGFSMDRKAE